LKAKAPPPNFFDPFLILQDLSHIEKIQFSRILEGQDHLNLAFAELFAKKLKTWAKHKGATHYNYWFQPSACLASEKPDAILSWECDLREIEQLNGSALIKAGAGVSSLSSLGLPERLLTDGFLSWDVSSRPFILDVYPDRGRDAKYMTLWIPSLYSSSKGEPLDLKIPLLRSVEKLSTAVLRLLKLSGVPSQQVVPHLKIKQQFYVVDHKLVNEFPGLAQTGRAVYGGKFSFSGSSQKANRWESRLRSFVHEVEEASACVGNEIEINPVDGEGLQYEAIAKRERVSLAIDGNSILMKIMQQIGRKHGVVPLFHEKPFNSFPTSDKYLEWSLCNQDGSKLDDPVLWVLMTAIIHALHEHQDLFNASISCMSQDKRPSDCKRLSFPLTIDLGIEFSQLMQKILSLEPLEPAEMGLDLIVKQALSREPFFSAFCRFSGRGFEFRGLSASASPSFAVCVIQSAVADSLQLIVDEISDVIEGSAGRSFFDCIIPVLCKHLKEARHVIWDIPCANSKSSRSFSKKYFSLGSFEQLISQKSVRTFENVFSRGELQRFRSICLERYVRTVEAEVHLITHLFRMKILPALNGHSKEKKIEFSHQVNANIEQAIVIMADLDKLKEQMLDLGVEVRAKVLYEIGVDKMIAALSLIEQFENFIL
jgi:glutamine synthetase